MDEEPWQCPRCDMMVNGGKNYSVRWEEKENQFVVSVVLLCVKCGYVSQEEMLKKLPYEIAKDSKCSKGHALVASDYSFSKKENDIVFKGTFVCKTCNTRPKKVIISGIKNSIMKVWKDTKELQFGPKGFVFKKK